MYITRKDIDRIKEIMDEWPDVPTFKLVCESSSGIGSILSLEMDMLMNNKPTKVTVEVSGVEDW